MSRQLISSFGRSHVAVTLLPALSGGAGPRYLTMFSGGPTELTDNSVWADLVEVPPNVPPGQNRVLLQGLWALAGSDDHSVYLACAQQQLHPKTNGPPGSTIRGVAYVTADSGPGTTLWSLTLLPVPVPWSTGTLILHTPLVPVRSYYQTAP